MYTPAVSQQKNQEIRPTTDRAREALFSILNKRIQKAAVLDLCAGTGAIGLEAISRGCGAVLFIDKNPASLKLIKKNILACLAGIQTDAIIRVVQQDILRPVNLAELPAELHHFDIIIADPPYGTGLSSYIIQTVTEQNLLKKGGLLVVEERHTIPIFSEHTGFILRDRRVYGEVAFHFYEREL